MNNFEEISLGLISGGKAIEQFDYQLKQAILNCIDPNTDSDFKRIVNLKIIIQPSTDRKDASLFFQTTTKLAPDSAGGEHLYISKGKAYVQDMEQLTLDEFQKEGEELVSIIRGE